MSSPRPARIPAFSIPRSLMFCLVYGRPFLVQKTKSSGCRARPARPKPVTSERPRDDFKFIFAISYAQAIQAFIDRSEDALRSELKRWEPEARATVVRALAEVG